MKLVGVYYKTSMENATIAMGKQPAVVDARSQIDFILDRAPQKNANRPLQGFAASALDLRTFLDLADAIDFSNVSYFPGHAAALVGFGAVGGYATCNERRAAQRLCCLGPCGGTGIANFGKRIDAHPRLTEP